MIHHIIDPLFEGFEFSVVPYEVIRIKGLGLEHEFHDVIMTVDPLALMPLWEMIQ